MSGEATTSTVAEACKSCYSDTKPCNYFVRDVAKMLGVTLPSSGDADTLIQAAKQKWTTLNQAQAITTAAQGTFVLAGMTSTELNEGRGHVAIVVPGTIRSFPKVYSTNEGKSKWGKSRGTTPLTEVFPASAVKAGMVRYFTPRA
jgi:hypothetical protein